MSTAETATTPGESSGTDEPTRAEYCVICCADIFAGAGERKALGRAEVTLTIDNADGALPIEYAEVSITRRLFFKRTAGNFWQKNDGAEWPRPGKHQNLMA